MLKLLSFKIEALFIWYFLNSDAFIFLLKEVKVMSATFNHQGLTNLWKVQYLVITDSILPSNMCVQRLLKSMRYIVLYMHVHMCLYTDTCLYKDVVDSCIHTLKHSIHTYMTYMCTNSENISHEIYQLECPGLTEEHCFFHTNTIEDSLGDGIVFTCVYKHRERKGTL